MGSGKNSFASCFLVTKRDLLWATPGIFDPTTICLKNKNQSAPQTPRGLLEVCTSGTSYQWKLQKVVSLSRCPGPQGSCVFLIFCRDPLGWCVFLFFNRPPRLWCFWRFFWCINTLTKTSQRYTPWPEVLGRCFKLVSSVLLISSCENVFQSFYFERCFLSKQKRITWGYKGMLFGSP